MSGALNIFKTVTYNVTNVSATAYTAPIGYSAVVLLAQVSNTTLNTITISADHKRSTTLTNILTNAPLPKSDAISLLSGKLILQTGDGINVSASVNNAGQMILSILETANP